MSERDSTNTEATEREAAEKAAVDQVLDEQAPSAAATEEGAEEEVASLKDRALRLQAELENVRKRAKRELHDSLRYAAMPMLRDLLPVLDNMQRAIDAAQQTAEGAGLLDGFKMVHTQLEEVLNRHGCRKIEAMHEPFDPNLHEAVMQRPDGEYAAGTVVDVVQQGYQLHDRVVRPSQVIVAAEPSAQSEDS